MRSDENKSAETLVKEAISKEVGGHPPVTVAAELLMELHKFPACLAVSSAIIECFQYKTSFKQEAIVRGIQQLIPLMPVPGMCLRMAILSPVSAPRLPKEPEGLCYDSGIAVSVRNVCKSGCSGVACLNKNQVWACQQGAPEFSLLLFTI